MSETTTSRTLGLILACDHYPMVTPDPAGFDAQLRMWLADQGTAFSELEVFAIYDGRLPSRAGQCDAWIVSGTALPSCDSTQVDRFSTHQFLRAAAALGRPIYGINHGEHLIHEALAGVGAAAPDTPARQWSIRNPFRSFLGRDILHRFDPQSRRVLALIRPDHLALRGLFGSLPRRLA